LNTNKFAGKKDYFYQNQLILFFKVIGKSKNFLKEN